MEYGLIAKSLPHSFSKDIHGEIAQELGIPYEYELMELAEDQLGAFLSKRDFRGINVTIPYKQAVIPALDELSETAQRVGAVNTIVNHDGCLVGSNTDFSGMEALIGHAGISLAGAKVLILGTGGTSKTALAVAEHLGAREVLRVSRAGSGLGAGIISYDEARALHADAGIIINTTPSGMFPDNAGQPIDLTAFAQLAGVIDAVYNPLRTNLVLQARELGISAEGGLYMLVAQAVFAAELFLDRSINPAVIGRIYDDMRAAKENIVLIGMPSSGKTSVARRVGMLTGREAIDCDILIEERAGTSITKIFEEVGEPGFRDQEQAAIQELAPRTGAVIATGGGAVLRPQNVRALRQNGRLYLLQRPFDQLEATDGRPLTNSAAKLQAVFEERKEAYLAAADEVVPVEGGVLDVARSVVARHGAPSAQPLNTGESVVIRPSRAVGSVTAPPSKSMAHRLLICAGLAEGTSTVRGLELSDDVIATIACLRALGADIVRDGDLTHVRGVDVRTVVTSAVLPCNECGSTMRFFIPIAWITRASHSLTGSARLMERPFDVYEEIAAEQGLLLDRADGALEVQGPLRPGFFRVRGDVSSQFISGLLFALPLLPEDSRIKLVGSIESRPYIDLTLQALATFGIQARWENATTLVVPGDQRYCPCDVAVEGDWSNAAFLDAFNTIGGHVRVEGLDDASLQGDRVYREHFAALVRGVAGAAGSLPAIDIADCPDLGPVLMAVAALHQGGNFTGTRRLAIKESDRAAAMAEELGACGASVTVGEDSVLVRAGGLHAPSRALSSHGDHRIAMALAVVLSQVGGQLDGATAVRKSYPGFFAVIQQLGIDVRLV